MTHDNTYSTTTTAALANQEYAAAVNQAAYLQGHYDAALAAINYAAGLPGAVIGSGVLSFAQEQAGAMADWWTAVTPDYVAKADADRTALNDLQGELNDAYTVQSAADQAAYQVNLDTVRLAQQTLSVDDANTRYAYVSSLVAAGSVFANSTAARRKTLAYDLAGAAKYLALGEKDGNPYTVSQQGTDIDLANAAYDRGLLQTDLDYAPLNVAAQVSAVNANADDWLTWIGTSAQARTTSGILYADSQLVFEQTKHASEHDYRVGLADRQQAFDDGSRATYVSTLVTRFPAGQSAMGDFTVAEAQQAKDAAVQQGLRDYKASASLAEKTANDAISQASRDRNVADLNNRQTAETAGATADRDYSFNAGQVATDAASTGHFKTATPIAPKPGEITISQLTERDYFGYWTTVSYAQGLLIGDMYKSGPQYYYVDEFTQGSYSIPASKLDSELLRGGLVLKRRPYDPLNEQFNDYNPYRTSGEFKPREDSDLIVQDRARPDEVQLLMQNPISYQTDPNAAQLVSPLADIDMLKACFAGDTLVPTPDGYKPIGEFAIGDEVYSRHELNPNGETVVVKIDKVFRRMGNIFEVYLNGRKIETTREHPFHVFDRGWTSAGKLKIGDRVLGLTGTPITVTDLQATSRIEQVFNIRVPITHTYFVGSDDWGFDAWTHNEYEYIPKSLEDLTFGQLRHYIFNGQAEIEIGGHTYGTQDLRNELDQRLKNAQYDDKVIQLLKHETDVTLAMKTHAVLTGTWTGTNKEGAAVLVASQLLKATPPGIEQLRKELIPPTLKAAVTTEESESGHTWKTNEVKAMIATFDPNLLAFLEASLKLGSPQNSYKGAWQIKADELTLSDKVWRGIDSSSRFKRTRTAGEEVIRRQLTPLGERFLGGLVHEALRDWDADDYHKPKIDATNRIIYIPPHWNSQQAALWIATQTSVESASPEFEREYWGFLAATGRYEGKDAQFFDQLRAMRLDTLRDSAVAMKEWLKFFTGLWPGGSLISGITIYSQGQVIADAIDQDKELTDQEKARLKYANELKSEGAFEAIFVVFDFAPFAIGEGISLIKVPVKVGGTQLTEKQVESLVKRKVLKELQKKLNPNALGLLSDADNLAKVADKLDANEFKNLLNQAKTHPEAAKAMLDDLIRAVMPSCFAADTPILTPAGSKPIQSFRPGDEILARDDRDPYAPVWVSKVEEVFILSAPILEVEVGGQTIATTAEHPFFVYGQGWTAAGDLQVGQLLAGKDGEWTAVTAANPTGRRETVYNLRVSVAHTYFVGADDWGFAVWVHNTYTYQKTADDVFEILDAGKVVNTTKHEDVAEGLTAVLNGSRYMLRTEGGVAELWIENGALIVRAPGTWEPADLLRQVDKIREIAKKSHSQEIVVKDLQFGVGVLEDPIKAAQKKAEMIKGLSRRGELKRVDHNFFGDVYELTIKEF